MSFRSRAQYRQNYRGRSQFFDNYRNDFRKENLREMQNYRGQKFRGIQVILAGMTKAVVEDQDQI